MTEDDPLDEISQIEAQIEELAEVAGRCRRFVLASQAAIAGGFGLLLVGDGRGGFRAVDVAQSGVQIFGEQRGAAVSDYDRDGRTDLVIAQNGGATQLFRNSSAKPGLRVRLEGGDANPDAVGASVRLRFGERTGPRRELHAGSGYWSQDSAVAVLGMPEPPTEVWVRWPGGQETKSVVPAGAAEVVIKSGGQIEAVSR